MSGFVAALALGLSILGLGTCAARLLRKIHRAAREEARTEVRPIGLRAHAGGQAQEYLRRVRPMRKRTRLRISPTSRGSAGSGDGDGDGDGDDGGRNSRSRS